jgi:hypothetical protein
MGEDTHEREILDLIELVDRNQDAEGRQLFGRWDMLGGYFIVLLFIIGALLFLIVFFGYLYWTRQILVADMAALDISVIAFYAAFWSTIIPLLENSALEFRFRRALPLGPTFNKDGKPFTENQKLILKALIKIRGKHDKFALKDVYDKNKEMFTREKLIEKLYE